MIEPIPDRLERNVAANAGFRREGVRAASWRVHGSPRGRCGSSPSHWSNSRYFDGCSEKTVKSPAWDQEVAVGHLQLTM